MAYSLFRGDTHTHTPKGSAIQTVSQHSTPNLKTTHKRKQTHTHGKLGGKQLELEGVGQLGTQDSRAETHVSQTELFILVERNRV